MNTMDGEDANAASRVDQLIESFRQGVPGTGRVPQPPIGAGENFGESVDGWSERARVVAPFREPGADLKRHPFEVYVIGYTGEAQTTARVQVAWGTVLKAEDDIGEVAEITDLDEVMEITEGDWIWIECDFTVDGDLTTCALKSGGTWTDHPACYKDNGESGNRWYHPIAQVRQSRTGRSVGKENAPFPDSGEFPDLNPSLVIAQLTHTHLVVSRKCVAGAAMKRLWALVPGQGGAQE